MIAPVEAAGEVIRYDENVKNAVMEAYGDAGLNILDSNLERIKLLRILGMAGCIFGAVLFPILAYTIPMLIVLLIFAAPFFVAAYILHRNRYLADFKSALDELKYPARFELRVLEIKAGRVPGFKPDELKAEIAEGMLSLDKLYSRGLDSGLCPACRTETYQSYLRDGGYGAYCPTCKGG